MNSQVVLDASIWIAAQREPRSTTAVEFRRLLEADCAVGVGPVLTELLEGARDLRTRNAVHAGFGAIAFIEADQRTWDTAGTIRRRLRAGNQVIGFADTIIAAIAVQHGLALYTLDRDYQRIDGLRLHRAGDLDCA